ncbi:MAG: hypothetical protein II364_02095, partial [Bacteroidales bacterium]|nr:hypothetical protein [Bacteroidales bacterium]
LRPKQEQYSKKRGMVYIKHKRAVAFAMRQPDDLAVCGGCPSGKSPEISATPKYSENTPFWAF